MILSDSAKKKIKEGWKYDVLFGKGLANHLPMAVTALERMGGQKDQIERFSNIYIKKLESVRKSTLNRDISFENDLGNRDSFLAYLIFFKSEIKKNGLEEVLDKYLERLFSGVSASAFHALIRLAYALEINSIDEIAISLAFWSSEYQYNGKIGKYTDKNIYNIFNELKSRFDGFDPGQGVISEKIDKVVNWKEFKIDSIQPKQIELADIAILAIKLYLTSGDFILLHGVTASHALRIVLPFVKDKNAALRYFWISLLAALLISDSEEIKLDRLPNSDYNEKNRIEAVFKKVLRSNDDHTIKIVYSCWQEFLFYRNYEYIMGMEMRL